MASAALIVSPESYPWDLAKEQSFLEHELEVLADTFERVIVVPQRLGGERLALPRAVELDESYARELAALSPARLLAHATATTLVSEEVVRRPTDVANPTTLRNLLAFAGRAHHAYRWTRRALARHRLAGKRVVLYTYWWNATTTGFGLVRRRHPLLRVASRAHGYDLYEERHRPPYLPCRHRSLQLLDGLFPDSDAGLNYLRARYGAALRACETARLGVVDPHVTCPPSADGVLRVVSCSVQVPVKRLHLLIDGLAFAGREKTSERISWTHFGTGPLEPELKSRAAQLPSNVTAHFAGYSTQRELLRWYGENPVDVFVNVSQSEGTPVAIMEAIACSIPVLATAVGGNVEIVTSSNGRHLPADPTAAEIAAGLLHFRSGPTVAAARAGSREVWRTRYDLAANAALFADRLLRL